VLGQLLAAITTRIHCSQLLTRGISMRYLIVVHFAV
jgi:hypothetical protein